MKPAAALAFALLASALAAVPPDAAQVLSAPAAMQRLLRAAARNQVRFQRERALYTYRRDFAFYELSDRYGNRGGHFQSLTDITYTTAGRPVRRVLKQVNALRFLRLDQGDRYDLRHILPLVLTPQRLQLYYCRFLGMETVALRDARGRAAGSLRAARFRISPLQTWPRQRYFSGSVWIDPRTRGLVEISGRPVPDYAVRRHGREWQHLFGRFTTWFRLQDGKWWFPAYSAGSDWLGFSSGAVEVKEVVRYIGYKKFEVRHRIQLLPPPRP